jgi:microsomal epoxide hydrolase
MPRRTRRRLAALLSVLALLCALPAAAAPASRFFTASDGVRLHYLEAGRGAVTVVFVPGWTMPAEIWQPQLDYFARACRVIAFDPRGQGRSQVARSGYVAERRAQDIKELLDAIGREPVVLVGWSLGVLESLAYLRFHGAERVSALVLVDNSIGEEPPPVSDPTFLARLRKNRAATVEGFVRRMYRQPQSEAYYRHLVQASQRMPVDAAVALLSYPYPREFWREIVYATDRPLLYAVSERFRGQADNLKRRRPQAWTEVFANAGHALFVDEAARFNVLLDDFIHQALRR